MHFANHYQTNLRARLPVLERVEKASRIRADICGSAVFTKGKVCLPDDPLRIDALRVRGNPRISVARPFEKPAPMLREAYEGIGVPDCIRTGQAGGGVGAALA